MRLQRIGSQILFIIVFPISTILAGCTPKSIPGTSPELTAGCQTAVDGILALTQDLPDPVDINISEAEGIRKPNWFDVNQYFSVLSHISVQEGYLLDYVYNVAGRGGHPFIYTRLSDQEPYPNFTTISDNILIPEGDKISSQYENDERARKIAYTNLYDSYLQHIKVDEAPVGFVQFVIFWIMGDQFYLKSFGNYNDLRIVCNYQGLEQAIADAVKDWDLDPADFTEMLNRSKFMNLEPSVTFEEGAAIVKIYSFTKWGGLEADTYKINAEFPHLILDLSRETLIEYQWGGRF